MSEIKHWWSQEFHRERAGLAIFQDWTSGLRTDVESMRMSLAQNSSPTLRRMVFGALAAFILLAPAMQQVLVFLGPIHSDTARRAAR